MAAQNPGNQIARRIVDDLIEFSGETSSDGYLKFFFGQQIGDRRGFIGRMRSEAAIARSQIAQLTALIVELEAGDNVGEVWDALMQFRDDRAYEQANLDALNGMIARAEEKVQSKQHHVDAMQGDSQGV